MLTVAQIDAIYQSLYGRNPTTAELTAAASIDASFGDQAVVTALVNSSETSTYDFAVYTIIKAATGVAPTQAQISGWVSYLEQAAPGAAPGSFALIQAEQAMVAAFAASTQFQTTYHISPTAQSTNAFVTALIANTQGTVATSAQLAAWGTGSGYTVGVVFAAFATNDASVAANKAAIITLLTNFADLAAGLPPVGTGQVFTLTPAIDTITTGTGNDIYNAQLGVAPDTFAVANTLNTGDTIKDTGLNNVLNLQLDVAAGVAGLPPNAATVVANSIIVQGVQTWNVSVVGGVAPTIDAVGATAAITGLLTLNVSNSTAGNNFTLGGAGAGNGIGSLLSTVGLTNDQDQVTVWVAASSLAAGSTLTVNTNGSGTIAVDEFLQVAPDTGTTGYATWSVATTGTNFLELAANGLTSATTLNVSGSGVTQLDGTGGNDWTKVKTISEANETGNVFITGASANAAGGYTAHGAPGGFLTGNTALTSYTGGSGNDIVDLSSLSLANLQAMTTLNGGTGTSETLIVSAAVAGAASGSVLPTTGFTTLGIGAGAAPVTVTMTNFPGINGVTLYGGSGTFAATINKAANNFTFNWLDNFTSNANGGVVINGVAGASTVNLQIGQTAYFETAAAANTALDDVFTNGFGIVNLLSVGTTATNTMEGSAFTAAAGSAIALNISGTSPLSITGGITSTVNFAVQLAGNGTSITDIDTGLVTLASATGTAFSTNAAAINAGASGGLIMIGGDSATIGTAGDVITGSATKANILVGSVGNDVFTGSNVGGDGIWTNGGGDTITLGGGHAASDNIFLVGDSNPAGANVALAQSITSNADLAQPGFWGIAPGGTPTAPATLFPGTGATATFGTSADQSVVANFVAGTAATSDVLSFSVGAWGTAATNLGLVDANLATPAAVGNATIVAVAAGGTITSTTADLIELIGTTFASAAAVAQALKTGSFGLTFSAAGTLNDTADLLVAYQDSSGNTHIADLAITEAASASAAAQVHISGSDMVQLTGVTLASLAANNVHFIA